MSLKRIWPTALAPVAAVGFVPATGRATSMSAPPTLADMVRDASEIVVGTVKDVREVRQGALPVMEVEVAVLGRSRRDDRLPAALPHGLEGRSAERRPVPRERAGNAALREGRAASPLPRSRELLRVPRRIAAVRR